MSHREHVSYAAHALRLFDAAGELAMLGWLADIPTDATANQRWQTEGIAELPDGSAIEHFENRYRFTHAANLPAETRSAVMSCHHRPELRPTRQPELVHIHIIGSSGEAWGELHDFIRSKGLEVEVHGNVTPEKAASLAADGRAESIMGIMIDHFEGPQVMNADLAYELIENFAESVRRHGLGNLSPKPAGQLTSQQWDGLIECCAAVVDLDWRFQTEVVDRDWLTANARRIAGFLVPAVAGGQQC